LIKIFGPERTNFIDNGSGKAWIMKTLEIHEHIELRGENRHESSDKIFFATPNRLYEGQLKNYSLNGLFIRTKENLPIGEIITVVDPHMAGKNQKRQGRILWKNNEGFGAKLFQRINEKKPKVIRFRQRSDG
jgi:hypothetical protein